MFLTAQFFATKTIVWKITPSKKWVYDPVNVTGSYQKKKKTSSK